MNPLLRLGVVAAVLVLLVLVFANPFQDSIRSDDDAPAQPFLGVAAADANRITIAPGTGAPSVLARGDGGWVVESKGDFPADTAAVGIMLRSAAGVHSMGVVSNNPENRSKFQVDSTGVRVTISGPQGDLAVFTVGKQGQDFTTSYVRKEGLDEVHVVRGLNRNMFVRAQGLRDRTLLAFEPSLVRSVRLEEPGGGWEIVRTDTAWTVQGAGSADTVPAKGEAVDRLLQTLASLGADGFLEGSPDTVDTGLMPPHRTLSVEFTDGSGAGIAVGEQNPRKQYYVSRRDRPAVYLVAEWRMNNAFPPYADLVREGGGE